MTTGQNRLRPPGLIFDSAQVGNSLLLAVDLRNPELFSLDPTLPAGCNPLKELIGKCSRTPVTENSVEGYPPGLSGRRLAKKLVEIS